MWAAEKNRELISADGKKPSLCMHVPKMIFRKTTSSKIGPKTAACVLLFALGKPALPVDTHVYRIAKRLGLIGPKVSADAAHSQLEAALPAKAIYAFHINMIQHGKRICHAQRPKCFECPLNDICNLYQGVV